MAGTANEETRPWAAITRDVFAAQCGNPVVHTRVSAAEFALFAEAGEELAAMEPTMPPEEFKAHLLENKQYGAEWGQIIPLICGWRLWMAGIRSEVDRFEYVAQADGCAECGCVGASHLHHVIQRPPRSWLAAESVFVLCESCHTKAHQGEL
jgi:hypothetical protein